MLEPSSFKAFKNGFSTIIIKAFAHIPAKAYQVGLKIAKAMIYSCNNALTKKTNNTFKPLDTPLLLKGPYRCLTNQ